LRQAFVVLGMYHSGVSVLAKLVSLLARSASAAAPGQRDAILTDSVSALNSRILEDLGATWDRPFLFILPNHTLASSAPLITAHLMTRYLDDALEILQSSLPEEDPIVIADPQTSLLCKFWGEALRRAGFTPKYLMVNRNPLDVIKSLKNDDDVGLSRSQQIWLRYTMSALEYLGADYATPLLTYESLVTGSADNIRTLMTALSIQASDDRVRAAKAAINLESDDQAAASGEIEKSPIVANLVKDAYHLVSAWNTTAPSAREPWIRKICETQDDYSRFAGNLAAVKIPSMLVTVPRSESKHAMRPLLLLHYHLFKNAGTSMDSVLKRNFGPKWEAVEFLPPTRLDHSKAIQEFIAARPNLLALSSHTLVCPPPTMPYIDVFPIIFVRHPLERLRSAYTFERKQTADTVGAQLAKDTDFAGYLRARLTIKGDRSCQDFQAYRLASLMPPNGASERDRALMALDQLPFVGLVEAFADSVELLKQCIEARIPTFQPFNAHENTAHQVTERSDVKRPSLLEELGEQTFELVTKSNQVDMEIYEAVVHRYGVLSRRREQTSTLQMSF
jgi:hypothetical protein